MVFSSRGAHSGVSAPGSPDANSVNNDVCDETTIPFSERRSFVNAKIVGIQYRQRDLLLVPSLSIQSRVALPYCFKSGLNQKIMKKRRACRHRPQRASYNP